MVEDTTVLRVLGGALVAAASVVAYRACRFLRRAASAKGEVIAVRPYNEQRTTRYEQLLRFEANGTTVSTWLKAGLPYQVGTQVDVYFDPGDPAAVRVRPQIYRPIIVLLVLAAVALIASLSSCS